VAWKKGFFMDERCERIALNINGYIMVGSEELMISVVNISLTGFLAKIEPTVLIPTVRELFQGISEHKLIEFNLHALSVSGLCMMVWSKSISGQFLTGFEFYESRYDSLILKSTRRFYRQAQALKGILRHEGLTYNFTTTDTSALGMMVYVIGPVGFKKKEKVTFEIQEKRMTGMGEVVWLHYDNDKNSAIMGLKFSTLSNS